jgi:hypothetical protein
MHRTSLVQELKGRVSGIIAVRAEGDKASRMAVASAKFEAGQALLPERAPWLADLEAELFVFPGSRHDDQCDSISQALLDKNNSFMDVAHTRRLGPPHRKIQNADAKTRPALTHPSVFAAGSAGSYQVGFDCRFGFKTPPHLDVRESQLFSSRMLGMA